MTEMEGHCQDGFLRVKVTAETTRIFDARDFEWGQGEEVTPLALAGKVQEYLEANEVDPRVTRVEEL